MGAVGQGLLSSVGRLAGRPARQYRWNALIGQAAEAIARRRLADAVDHLVQAFAIAHAEWPGGERLGESLLRLADLKAALEMTDEAMHLYARGISVLACLPEGIDSRLALAAGNLGRLFLLKGEPRNAAVLIEAGTALQRKLGEPDTPALQLNRALIAAAAGHDDDAQLAFNDAIAALDRLAGPRDLQGVAIHDNYALFCASRDRLDDAEVLLRRCLILRQEAAGPRHAIYAAGLVNLARVRLGEDQADHSGLDETRALLWQAADICERAGPRPASGLLPALYYMARLACLAGRADEAASLCDRMLEFGKSDPHAEPAAEAASLHILAKLQRDGCGPAGDGEAALRRALGLAGTLAGGHRTLGHDMIVGLLSDLAEVAAASGRTAEAERLAGRSAELRRTPVWALSRQIFPSV